MFVLTYNLLVIRPTKTENKVINQNRLRWTGVAQVSILRKINNSLLATCKQVVISFVIKCNSESERYLKRGGDTL